MTERMERSRAQEARGARQHGGRVQPGSGSGRYNKGDVKTPFELIEYKRTDKKTIRLDSVDIAELRDKALIAGRDPMFGVEVGGRDYVLIDQFDLECLVDRRAREIAGDIVQRRLGNAGPAEPEVQPAAEVRGRGEQRERDVLPGAAPVSKGRQRRADDSATDGGAGEGLLPRPKVRGRPRLPRADRVSAMGNGKLAEVRGVGRVVGTGASQAERGARNTGRASRLIGGGAS